MTQPNRITELPNELPFDHAAAFVEALDATLDAAAAPTIFIINPDGTSRCVRDRRIGFDRRSRTRRAEDKDAEHASIRHDIEQVKAHNRRMWALGAICYLTGLVTSLILLGLTS